MTEGGGVSTDVTPLLVRVSAPRRSVETQCNMTAEGSRVIHGLKSQSLSRGPGKV